MIFHIALFERGGLLWYATSFAFGATLLTIRRAACTVGRTAAGIRSSCSDTVIRAAALIRSPPRSIALVLLTVTTRRRSGSICVGSSGDDRADVAPGPRLAHAPPAPRSHRNVVRARGGPPTVRSAGPGGLVGRARGPTPSQVVASRRSRARSRRRTPRQDVGDAGHTAPAHPGGRRRRPLADGGGTLMGTAELGALLRHDEQALGRAAPGGPRGARREAPYAGRVDRGGRGPTRARSSRGGASIRMGNAP